MSDYYLAPSKYVHTTNTTEKLMRELVTLCWVQNLDTVVNKAWVYKANNNKKNLTLPSVNIACSVCWRKQSLKSMWPCNVCTSTLPSWTLATQNSLKLQQHLCCRSVPSKNKKIKWEIKSWQDISSWEKNYNGQILSCWLCSCLVTYQLIRTFLLNNYLQPTVILTHFIQL